MVKVLANYSGYFDTIYLCGPHTVQDLSGPPAIIFIGGPVIIKIKIAGAPSIHFSYLLLNNSWSTGAHMIAGPPVLIPN